MSRQPDETRHRPPAAETKARQRLSELLLPPEEQQRIVRAVLGGCRRELHPWRAVFTRPLKHGKITVEVLLTKEENQQYREGRLPQRKVRAWLNEAEQSLQAMEHQHD